MSYESAKAQLEKEGIADHITVHSIIADTVAHAAQIIGCKEAEIAKSMTFEVDGKGIVVVAAGDVKIAGAKFKNQFKVKSTMLARDKVEDVIGHAPGGVCPFGLNDGVLVYLDESLKRFEEVHAAGGRADVTVRLTLDELEKHSHASGWVDVCKPIEE